LYYIVAVLELEIFLNHPKIALIEAVALVKARNETKAGKTITKMSYVALLINRNEVF